MKGGSVVVLIMRIRVIVNTGLGCKSTIQHFGLPIDTWEMGE